MNQITNSKRLLTYIYLMNLYQLFFPRQKYKAIVYPTSVYSLFLYEMMELYKKEETLFIFRELFAPFGRNICPDYWEIKEVIKNYKLSRLHAYLISSIIWCLSRRYKNIPVYVNGGERHARLFQLFFSHVIFLEDGLGNYLLRDPGPLAALPKQKFRQRFINPSFPPLGMDKKVRTIYLTGFLPVPAVVAPKVRLVSLKELWENKTEVQRREICSAYLPADWESVLASGREILLLTQPWNEDCYTYPEKNFTDGDEIELYKTILEGYDEKQVIIKTHPRERTDYRHFFPETLVIDTPTPMELFLLVGLKIKKAITVSSSSIHTFDDSVERVLLGTEITPKIKNETERRRKDYNGQVQWQDDSLVEKYDKGH